MGKGKAWRTRLILLFAITTYALLLAADIAPNPFPGIWDWLGRDRPLAPDLAWQERLGSRPAAAAPAGDSIAVAAGNHAELRDRDSGDLISPAAEEDWDADWVVVAGEGDDAVVILGPDGGDGYEVRDPDTGRLVHEDEDAVAVWGFQDRWLDLRCGDGRACQLRAFRPGQREPLWTRDLPGQRVGMIGGNPELAAGRTPEPSRIHSGVAGPPPVPPRLGFPVTRDGGDVVVVVDTGNGQVVQQRRVGDGERVILVGGRLVGSTMARHNGVCVGEVTGYDAVTGDPVWGPLPYHLWSTGDVGCEQRIPPLNGGAAMTAVSQDGRPTVLDAYDGRVLWTGEREERIEALSPERAVIRAGDGTTRYGVLLGRDGERLWEQLADSNAGITFAPCGVVVADRDPNRVYVWDPATGEVVHSVSTSARVLTCGEDGMLIADGRSIGFASFDDGPSPAESTAPPPLDSK
jgi:outer membrane protein assembly factor BamB